MPILIVILDNILGNRLKRIFNNVANEYDIVKYSVSKFEQYG